MYVRTPWMALAALGGIVFAAGGAVMGSMNAGAFGLQRDADAVFPFLGLGVLMLATGWAASRQGWGSTFLGKAAAALVVLGAVFFLANPVLQFAILGTLSFGLGLVLFTVTLWRQRLMTGADRLLATLAAVGSLTWNTETLSAFLLVPVGLLLAVLSVRMRPAADRQDS
ncbi:MAG: hypothetical protein R3246_05320 [Acidimicrobiia bacterium]|nr:hypothetical protein [Acidimicrobiia bacterium]